MSGSASRPLLALMAIGALALLLSLYVWATRDVESDSVSVSPVASIVVRPRLAGFAKLTALAERVRQAKVDASRLPSSYDVDQRAADEALDSDLVRGLPRAVEEVLEPTPGASAEADLSPQAGGTTWPAAHTAVRLLVFQMQRQWARKDDRAWETGRRDLQFVRVLLSQARSFSELTSSELSCADLLRALSSAIDARRLTPTQLRELEDLAEPGGLVREVLDATRTEYAIFEAQLTQVEAQAHGLLSRLFFQPNRTRQAWLAAMAGPVQALQRGDVAAAHEALAAAPALSGHRPLARNSLGAPFVAMSIRGNLQALAQAVDLVAELGLLRVRAAMAGYRQGSGHWPAELRELQDRHDRVPTTDPWAKGAPFRYSRSEGRIYSIGRDGRDDHGLFDRDLFSGSGASDLGLRFSKE